MLFKIPAPFSSGVGMKSRLAHAHVMQGALDTEACCAPFPGITHQFVDGARSTPYSKG